MVWCGSNAWIAPCAVTALAHQIPAGPRDGDFQKQKEQNRTKNRHTVTHTFIVESVKPESLSASLSPWHTVPRSRAQGGLSPAHTAEPPVGRLGRAGLMFGRRVAGAPPGRVLPAGLWPHAGRVPAQPFSAWCRAFTGRDFDRKRLRLQAKWPFCVLLSERITSREPKQIGEVWVFKNSVSLVDTTDHMGREFGQ